MIIPVLLIILSVCAGHFVFSRKPYISQKEPYSAAVTIIIPARNEAHNLPHLLTSLSRQETDYQCLVIDDGSTDNTVEVARQYGARVIPYDHSLAWQGKSAVCYFGAGYAEADLLLFLDADITLDHEHALRDIISTYNGGLISIQPYHRTKQLYEQLSVWFNVLTIVGLNKFAAIQNDDAAAFGPVVLCSKAHYFMTGGHYGARHHIIEGFGLAHLFKQAERPVTALLGKETISFRMYPEGLRAMSKGWAKHFASGAQATKPWVMGAVVIWMLGSVCSMLFFAWSITQSFSAMLFAGLLYLFYTVHFHILSRRTGTFTFMTALLASVAFFYFIYVFTCSWINTFILKKVEWKDRNIKL
ncbi:glycosyltransferase [Macrococcus carouselicus]|uniref:4,4'-diaponeurosporenoate glycosyltransferase n=1 Tax=Macrococcus carouselicus TaxID=69969 RepID=A0A9Q8CIY2_9STAP|nr:glycosyltransferase family 2 protein [Macrococcus carouselicus]TDM02287.1 glycosyltransferase family 2 protein [Macrococcus carouselicus]